MSGAVASLDDPGPGRRRRRRKALASVACGALAAAAYVLLLRLWGYYPLGGIRTWLVWCALGVAFAGGALAPRGGVALATGVAIALAYGLAAWAQAPSHECRPPDSEAGAAAAAWRPSIGCFDQPETTLLVVAAVAAMGLAAAALGAAARAFFRRA